MFGWPRLQAFGDNKSKQAALLISQAANFAKCMLQVYEQLQAQLQDRDVGNGITSSQRHYCKVTPRDLTAWVQGLKR